LPCRALEPSAQAQAPTADPASAPLDQVQGAANIRLQAGDYAGAVPYLEEIIKRLSESTDPKVIETLEPIYYSLGFGQVNAQQYDRALVSFDNYLTKFPKGRYAAEVVHLKADTLRLAERWPQARRRS
jgi:outer membrane protein assembly factor BamD (BamD/ComL family)